MRETIEGIDIHRRGGEYTVYVWAPWYYLRHFRSRYDVVIDAENGIPFFTPLFSDAPVIAVMHHVHRDVLLRFVPRPLNLIAWVLEAIIMPFVYRRTPFIAVSESTRSQMTRFGYSRLPITVVHNGLDHSFDPLQERASTPTIAYVGRLAPYKRLPEMLKNIVSILRELPGARLVVAGAGSDEKALLDVARELSVEDRVTILGRVDEKEKYRVMADAWVFVQPSEFEGWGLSVMEAASCGTPAVVMDVPGLRDAVLDGRTGFVAHDWSSYAAAVRRLLEDAPLRSRMSRAGRERALEFSWDRSANETMDVIEDVIASRSLKNAKALR